MGPAPFGVGKKGDGTMKRAIAINVAVLLILAVPLMAGARKPGRGNDTEAAGTACWAAPGTVGLGEGYTLNATGLPTDKALNIEISSPAGILIFPFGMSLTGTEAFSETGDVLGTETYTFMGAINGNTKIYARCSVEVV
jgi:hypothetical protein